MISPVISLAYGSSGSMADALSRLNTIADATPGKTLASFTYLGLDERVQMTYPQPGVQLTLMQQPGEPVGDGGDQYVGLDRFGRLVDQRWLNSTATNIERVQYGYSEASNRIWRQNPVAEAAGATQDEYYTNDGLYQLAMRQQGTLSAGKTGINGTPAAEEDFTYDPTGNRANYETKASGSVTLNQPRTHNVDNEITALSGSAALVAYDHAGNMTSTPQPANWSSVYTLTWDAWNRLVKVESGSTLVAAYAYDGLTRRTRKTAGTTTNDFYYSDQWKVLEVGKFTGGTASLQQFVWRGCDEDKLILCDEPSGSPIARLYALDDGKNVTAVCDTTGTVQERYGYSGFGAPVFLTASFGARPASSYAWETLFCGYRYDSETGLYQVRYRYLHAELGRWLSRDLLPEAELIGINLFAYVLNNAINNADRLGLAPNPNVSDNYCSAAKLYPDIQWLSCACKVSGQITLALLGILYKESTTTGPDHDFWVALAKWFICTRSCLAQHFDAALRYFEGQQLSPTEQKLLTLAWKECCEKCRKKPASKDCCECMVKAEQTTLGMCEDDGCGAYPGKSNPPGFPPGSDFNNLVDRIKYGIKLCCTKSS